MFFHATHTQKLQKKNPKVARRMVSEKLILFLILKYCLDFIFYNETASRLLFVDPPRKPAPPAEKRGGSQRGGVTTNSSVPVIASDSGVVSLVAIRWGGGGGGD